MQYCSEIVLLNLYTCTFALSEEGELGARRGVSPRSIAGWTVRVQGQSIQRQIMLVRRIDCRLRSLIGASIQLQGIDYIHD
jgi:hypothetical protein